MNEYIFGLMNQSKYNIANKKIDRIWFGGRKRNDVDDCTRISRGAGLLAPGRQSDGRQFCKLGCAMMVVEVEVGE